LIHGRHLLIAVFNEVVEVFVFIAVIIPNFADVDTRLFTRVKVIIG
jgi:hypothetical protein